MPAKFSDEQIEIRLAGEGGQGMILAGIILAEAAAIYDGKNALKPRPTGQSARRSQQSRSDHRAGGDRPPGSDQR